MRTKAVVMALVVVCAGACTNDGDGSREQLRETEPPRDVRSQVAAGASCIPDETFDGDSISEGEAIHIAFPHLSYAACDRVEAKLTKSDGTRVWEIYLGAERPGDCWEQRRVDAKTGEVVSQVTGCP
jgi:hypothetical protein